MRIPTFVGKTNIELTEDEIQYVKSKFAEALKKYFLIENPTIITNISNNGLVQLTASQITPIGAHKANVGDNWFIHPGDTVIPNGNITIMLWHNKGYDEAETGPCYKWIKMGHPIDWKPELNKTSYTAKVLWNGMHKLYRHRNVSSLEIKNNYYYGTELDDLTFENSIITISKISKSLKKIYTK